MGANERILDPVVLRRVPEGHNVTAAADFLSAEDGFNALWRQVASHKQPKSESLWQQLMLPSRSESSMFAPSVLAVEPVSFGACASDTCIGVRVFDAACIC